MFSSRLADYLIIIDPHERILVNVPPSYLLPFFLALE